MLEPESESESESEMEELEGVEDWKANTFISPTHEEDCDAGVGTGAGLEARNEDEKSSVGSMNECDGSMPSLFA